MPSKQPPIPSPSQTQPKSFLPAAGRLSVTVIHDSTKSYGLRLAQHHRSGGKCNGSSKNIQNHSNSNDSIDRDRRGNGNGSGDDVVIDMIANTHSNGMLKGSPLEEGDLLCTINNRRITDFLGCRDSHNSDGCSSYIRGGSFRDGESVTFVAERPCSRDEHKHDNDNNNTHDNHSGGIASGDLHKEPESGSTSASASASAIVRAFCRKSTSNSNDDRAMAVGVEFHRVIVGDDEGEDGRNSKSRSNENESESEIDFNDSDSDSDTEDFFSSPPSPTKSLSPSSFLQIDRIDPNGLFARSVLNQGDIVLAINGYSICADDNITVEEANELMGIHPASSSPPLACTIPGVSVYETVDILALNPRKLLEHLRHEDTATTTSTLWGHRKDRQSWMKERAKTAGAALGGVVVHPFGTLLKASRVSVPGTDFEKPSTMVLSARDSFERWMVEDPVPEHQGYYVAAATVKCSRLAPANSGSVLAGAGMPMTMAAKPPSSATEKEDACDKDNSRNNSNQRCFRSGRIGNHTNASTPSLPPLPPSPSMTNRMKVLGRRYVIPFLDRIAGDRRSTNIESSSSFDINDGRNHIAAPTNWQLQQDQRQQQQQQQQQHLHQPQGRDDDCGHGHGSSSLEQEHQSISISQRVA